ncbi:dihydrodipicolinate synthase family protein [Streptomyces sp. NPDC050704]|uniref:dihydrodipicolinate synthase family protein n=1 Tax=Streptomyces sp. NPDC050704 TaxID=3157219 RepID=UPI0034335FB0
MSHEMSHDRSAEPAADSAVEKILGFTGSLVAIVTPFNQDGGIDYGALSELISMHERNHTAGLFFLGVAGEGATLDDDEFKVFVRTVLGVPHTVPFLIGCTGNSTAGAVRRVRTAAAHGADGVVLTVPANMGPDQDQAARYFLDIADSTAVPIGTFNNPARLLTDLDTATLLRILEHPRIVLHKEGSPRTGQIAELLAHRPKVCFLADDSPDQDILVPALARGAQGIANAAGNLLPREFARLSRPWRNFQDLADFRELHDRLFPLIKFLYSHRSPTAIKSLMNAVGLPGGHLRAPLTSLTEDQVKTGMALLKEYAHASAESAQETSPLTGLPLLALPERS